MFYYIVLYLNLIRDLYGHNNHNKKQSYTCLPLQFC